MSFFLPVAVTLLPLSLSHLQRLGWPSVGNSVGLGRVPVRYGSCSMPVPGSELAILDDDGQPVPPNTLGNMVIKTPLPPGTLQTIYNDDQLYVDKYLTRFPGYYETGDAAYIDDDVLADHYLLEEHIRSHGAHKNCHLKTPQTILEGPCHLYQFHQNLSSIHSMCI